MCSLYLIYIWVKHLIPSALEISSEFLKIFNNDARPVPLDAKKISAMVKWHQNQNIPQSISNRILNYDTEMYPYIRTFLCYYQLV